jgi:hypothetical protein
MASVYADPKLRSKRTYIATSSFNNQLYAYTTTMTPPTYVTTGSLGAVTGATAAACPRGHFLRETGARLYPAANPGISTLMVGVYDANSGLKGYIDPNAPIFAVFNSDKPVEMVDGGDNNTATVHKGQPVYTTGDVISSAGDVKALAGYVAGAAPTGIIDDGGGGNKNVYANPAVGNTFVATFNTGDIATGKTIFVYFGPSAAQPAPPAGTIVTLVLRNLTAAADLNITWNNTDSVAVGVSNVTGNAFTHGTTRAYTFASDGTNLYLTGSATY